MADDKIILGIGAEISGLEKGLDQAERKVSEFEKKIKNLANVGDQFTSIGKKLSIGISAPLTAIGALGVKTFSDFNAEITKVAAISGATGDELKSLEESAKELGRSTQFSASQVAGLQLNLSKLGFDTSAINKSTAAILDLALATGEDLAQSAEVAASTIQGFGLEADQAGRVADVMAKSFSSSALDLGKFSLAMSQIAPVASASNISLEESTALLSVLADAGLQASTSGTALRNIFLTLSKEGITLDQALDRINSSADKTTTAMDMFGTQGATAAVILAGNTDKAKELTKAYRDAEGSAKSMADVMGRTLEGAMARLSSATEGAGIAIGEVLAPYIEKLADGLGGIINKFTDLDKSTQKIIVVIGALAAGIGPLLLGVGSLLKALPIMVLGFKSIVGIIPAVVTGFKALTAAMLANPILATAAALLAVGTALTIYVRNANKAVTAAQTLDNVRKEATKSIASELSELESLIKVAEDETISKEDRLKAIEKLNDISPEYLGNLDLENIKTGEGTKLIDDYIESLNNKAIAQATASKRAELLARKLDLANDAYKVGEVGLGGYLTALKRTITGDVVGSTLAFAENVTEARREEVEAIDAQIEALDEFTKKQIISNNVDSDAVKDIDAKTKAIGRYTKALDISNLTPIGIDGGIGDGLASNLEKENARIKEALENRAIILTDAEIQQAEFNLMMKQFNQEFAAIAQSGVASAISSTFESIGEAIAQGGNVIGAIGQALLGAFTGFLSEMGDLLIKYGTLAVIKGTLDNAIRAGGFTAIAAGVAAIAIGGALKAASGALGSRAQSGFDGGGGSVDTNISSPSRGYSGSASGGSFNGGKVVFEIEGQKLVGVLSRTLDRNKRLGGSLAL